MKAFWLMSIRKHKAFDQADAVSKETWLEENGYMLVRNDAVLNPMEYKKHSMPTSDDPVNRSWVTMIEWREPD